MTATRSIGRSSWLLVALPALVHVALGSLIIAKGDALWLDEFMSRTIARGSWSDAVGFFRYLPEQHPAYYGFLWIWTAFGDSEVWLRTLSMLFSLGTLFGLFAVARRFNSTAVATVVGGLYAVSPYALYYGTEARMYSMMMMLGVLLLWSLLRYLDGGRGGALWTYFGIALVAIYTHFFGVLLVFCFGVYSFWHCRRDRGRLRNVLLAHVALFLAYTPWLWLTLASGTPEGQAWKGPSHLLMSIPYTLFRFSLGFGVLPISFGWQDDVLGNLGGDVALVVLGAVGYGIAVLAAAWAWYAQTRNSTTGAEAPTTTAALVQAAGPLGLSLLVGPVVILAGDRYFAVSFPAFLLLVAFGVSRLLTGDGRTSRIAGIAAMIFMAIPVTTSTVRMIVSPRYGFAQWAEVGRFLSSNVPAEAEVLAYPTQITGVLSHSLQDAHATLRVRPVADGDIPVDNGTAGQTPDTSWLVIAHSEAEWDEVVSGEQRLVAPGRCWLFPRDVGIRVFAISSGTDRATSIHTPECTVLLQAGP